MGGGWGSSEAAAARRALLAGGSGPGPGPGAGAGAGASADAGHRAEEPGVEALAVGGGAAAGEAVRPGGAHCWVTMPGTEPMPGLVAAWRRSGSGEWQARVAYALGDVETASVVTGWVPATFLRPAAGSL